MTTAPAVTQPECSGVAPVRLIDATLGIDVRGAGGAVVSDFQSQFPFSRPSWRTWGLGGFLLSDQAAGRAITAFIYVSLLCLPLLFLRVRMANAAGVVGAGNAASCTDAALDAALEDGGLVTFNCGGSATIDISTGTGGKSITADTIIDGGGVITISGGNVHRVFEVSNAVFTVRNLTITNAGGGAIRSSQSALTVTNSTFTDNVDSGFSGAIYIAGGLLNVANCSFSGNSGHYVGAIASLSTLNSSVTNSTFTGNSGAIGAAIAAYAGTVTITNSTFTRNIVPPGSFAGGAIYHENRASVVLRNTIVVESINGLNCDGSTASIDGGHNLDDGLSCGFSAASGSWSDTDPHLDPAGLQDNGGPTQTVALCTAVDEPEGCTAASPAIDVGDQAACADAPVNGLDQRGFMRPGATHTSCSIGAYEADAIESVCVGDCDDDSRVAVNELVLGVNIVLDQQSVSACPAFGNAEGKVDVTQLVKGVNNTLNGCGD